MEGVGFISGVGWIIPGAYFITNTAIKSATGESIGDHLGDAAKCLDPTSGLTAPSALESEFGPDRSGND